MNWNDAHRLIIRHNFGDQPDASAVELRGRYMRQAAQNGSLALYRIEGLVYDARDFADACESWIKGGGKIQGQSSADFPRRGGCSPAVSAL